jgi:phytoene synthase
MPSSLRRAICFRCSGWAERSVSAASTEAFTSFQNKWLVAQPENALVAIFLPADQRQRANAFGTLVHELEQTAFHAREPQVAATKLAWWRQELADAAAGNARHPISRALFGDGQTNAVDPQLWPAMAIGASAQIESPTAASMPELFAQLALFYVPIARVELALFADDSEFAESNAALWIISQLLRELANPLQWESRLPLDLLARHGAPRAALATAATLRRDVLKDHLATLTQQIRNALALASPPSLNRRVRSRLDLALATGAQRASDPLAYLTTHTPAGRWRSLMTAWREARAMARGR